MGDSVAETALQCTESTYAYFAGEAKPGIDGEEKGIVPFWNGDNELVAGDMPVNLLEC